MHTRMTLGERIRSRREGLGWSQTELARRISVYGQKADAMSVSRWETGRTTPTLASLANIAGALGVRAEWLTYGTGSPEAAEPTGGEAA